jgi:formate dehydrogenase iron-sulfur subunit
MLVELPLLNRADLLVPTRKPGPGEQFRFHFDMSKCIGCKCCVVGCNEQNGNPADLNWRRVGELEGGVFPNVQRLHLSMGCNHCVEPSCMIGCPVSAYSKDPLTGIVDHNPDMCIGCQYCTLNCSYGVPQYNEARGVVGKCDMCHNRLNQGMSPACVSACPEGALSIEIVNVDEWKSGLMAAADAPGLPSAHDSISTTRITLPDNVLPDLDRVDRERVEPQHPHWSLVFVLVLTQLSIGSITAIWASRMAGVDLPAWTAILAFAVAALALAGAPAHLGRPIHAIRAWRNFKTSWISREVITLSAFAGLAKAYAAALWFDLPYSQFIGAAAVLAGFAGVLSSARIYMLKARPAWNTAFTPVEFFLTAFSLGSLLIQPVIGAAFVAIQTAMYWARFVSLRDADDFERSAAAGLLSGPLNKQFIARMALGVAAAALAFASPITAFALALAAEITSRWLFFASVVPKSMASTFLKPGGSAK